MKAFTGLRPKKKYSMMKQSLGLRRRGVCRRISPLHGRFLNTANTFGLINLLVITLMRFVRFWRLHEIESCSFNSVICSDITLAFSLSLIGRTRANSVIFFPFGDASHQDRQATLIGNAGIHSVNTREELCLSSPVISPILSLRC